jgi:hypothetical protein
LGCEVREKVAFHLLGGVLTGRVVFRGCRSVHGQGAADAVNIGAGRESAGFVN